MNKKSLNNKRRAIASMLGVLMIAQQSVGIQAFAVTNITDVNNNQLKPSQTSGQYNITPDVKNGDVGFRKFNDFTLDKGDIANFIMKYYNQGAWTDSNGNVTNHETGTWDINTFVAAVKNQVNIDGVVNTLRSMNGDVGGNLILVSPNGVVVGASGVLNVGSLSVITPTQTEYDVFADKIKNAPVYGQTVTVQDGDSTHTMTGYFGAGDTDLTVPTFTIDSAQTVDVAGRIAANGNINVQTGTFATQDGSIIAAGVNNSGKGINAVGADTLFNSLVKTGNTSNIDVTTNKGVNIVNGSIVQNLGNGNTTITNTGADGVLVAGTLTNSNGNLTINNTGANGIGISGTVKNSNGILDAINSGKSGINISGTVENTGVTNITNQAGGTDGIKLTSTGRINNHGSSLNITNDATGGIDLRGVITGDNKALVNVTSNNSNVTIGDRANAHNIIADNTVTVNVTNGDFLNNGVTTNHIVTSDGADLVINATNGAIGEELVCANGICTGIGPNGRDLTKSINTSVDGTIKAISSRGDRDKSVVNMASIDKDMNIDQIKADGRVILLADSSTSGANEYAILNKSKDGTTANVNGYGISMIASGKIGEGNKKLTFIQTKGQFNDAYVEEGVHWQDGRVDTTAGETISHKKITDYEPNAEYGVDILSNKGDINIKGLDNSDGSKNDTEICAIVARNGNINAEFSGNTHIAEVTASDKVNLTTRGQYMVIDHLGEVPTYETTGDYFGGYDKLNPTQANITALDLAKPGDKNTTPHSTVVVKNGTLKGQGNGRPAHEQDLNIVADHAYAGGYEFITDTPHRGEDHKSYYKENNATGTLNNANDPEKPVSIRTTAVRPEHVKGIEEGPDENRRIYYTGGSSQNDQDGYDGYDKDNNPNDEGTIDDDDNLVVPEDKEDPNPPTPDPDDDDDLDSDIDNDIDNDADNDADNDTDNDTDNDSDSDSDPNPDPTPDPDPDPDKPDVPVVPDKPDVIPTPEIPEDAKAWSQRRDIAEIMPATDKRQYIRFNASDVAGGIEFTSSANVKSISNISRGGVALKHDKGLKVGDVVPVHIKYGDVEVNADVKIVSATDVQAGGQFIDLDQATANKILYLSMVEPNAVAVNEAVKTSYTGEE